MAERAGHRPPIIHAWHALWLCLVLAMALGMAGRAQSAPFAAVVMDARTGEILHSVNHTARLHPASLTKMMTLYVAFEAIQNGEISLDTMVRISARAASEQPSRLGLRAGQRIALRHLIRGAALRSGNDAATAIAEAISGSVEAFAQRMNRTAAAIGMSQTNFRNAHGLTQAGHMSSARDMTILGRQLFYDYPQYYGIFSRRSEDAGIAQVNNTNSRFLDGYRGADGIKTGFTNAAGYNLTAMAERNGVRIIVTVFGGRSVAHRHEQVVALMDRGFRAAPTRATVRRPARPNYARPTTRTAQAQAAPAEGRAAGRVIRLQTAPARSPFPMRRPGPGGTPLPAPSDEMIATLQTGIGAAIAELAAPPEPAAESARPVEVAALQRSPLPRARPVALAADPVAADVEAARAAGFSVISPEALAAVIEPDPDPAPEDQPEPEIAAETAPAPDLPQLAQQPPAARPSEHAPEPEPEPQALAAAEPAPEPEPEAEPEVELAALPVTEAPAPPGAAEVVVENGLVVIPGLPPIPLIAEAAAQVPIPPLGPDDSAEPGLVVTAEGQILWRDEDLLQGIDEVAPIVAGPPPIILTTEDAPFPPQTPAMPELTVRISSSGSQLWGVDLGRYGTRFDAERVLLRVALAEGATLGGGVRRVDERGGGFTAVVTSLTQDQATRACQRLASDLQNCAVIEP